MALTRTSLLAPIGASTLTLSVASTATGFPGVGVIVNPPQPIMVDQEVMFLVQVTAPGTLLVRSRGADGTPAEAHDISAPVVTSASPGDFPPPVPGFNITTPNEAPNLFYYGQNGAISQPLQPGGNIAALNGAAAIAMTLGAPSLAITGTVLQILTATAFAHTVSAPGLFQTGVAGGPFGTLTFPAQAGASVKLVAQQGFWAVLDSNGAVTFS